MSRRQVDACAERLQPREAAQFRGLIEASGELFMRSVAIRRAAWELYRKATGLPKQASHKKATR